MPNMHKLTRALLIAMRHSDQPMLLTDPRLPDDPIVAMNAAFSSATGYSENETIGRNCRFLQGPLTDPDMIGHIRRCLMREQGCVEWLLNYRSDGTKFWNLLFICPVFDENGRLLHFFGNQRDVTLGAPAGLPDFTLGPTGDPMRGDDAFHAVLHELLEQELVPAHDPVAGAHALERTIETVRRLNHMSTHPAPAARRPPPFN